MPADDTSINVGAGDEDDDLLAQANALLEDEPISSTRQIKKKVAIKRDTTLPSLSESKMIEANNQKEAKGPTKAVQISAPLEKIQKTDSTASNGASTVEKVTKDIVTEGEVSKSQPGLKANSDAERAKSRAERFGVVTTTNLDGKKAARAARFGTSNSSTKIGESPSVDLETLKRRAERFGQSTSTTMQKLELQEKIKGRESRFGKVEGLSTDPKRARITAPNENLLTDDKMKKRAERFGVKA